MQWLLPKTNISVQDQRDILSIGCHKNSLGANIGIHEYCETKCGDILNNAHIFSCPVLNTGDEKCEFEAILNGCKLERKKHLEVCRENMKKQ